MPKSNLDSNSKTAECYGIYILKKASQTMQHIPVYTPGASIVNNEHKQYSAFNTSGGCERWDTSNDEELGNEISMRRYTEQAPRDDMETIRNNPNSHMEHISQTHQITSRQQERQQITDKANNKSQVNKAPKKTVDAAVMQCIVEMDSCTSEDSDIKCRYCFGGPLGWVVRQPLISPCLCSGSLAYVHRSCLEKWLTIRKQSSCDLCKYQFIAKKKYKQIREIKFARMEAEDICLLVTTILVYITFIFQFLAAAYIGMLADHIPAPVLAVCMTGLSLGFIWFLVGCIALTVLTYTSDYWANWREMNKRFSIVMNSIKNWSNKSDYAGEDACLNVDESMQESNDNWR